MKCSAYKKAGKDGSAHQVARSASDVAGVGVRGLDAASVLGGVASVLRVVSAASAFGLGGGGGVCVGVVGVGGVGVGGVAEGSWSRMTP